MAKYENEDFEGAVEDFSKALKVKSDYLKAMNNRASAYIKMEEYNKAIQDCNTIIKKDPKYGFAYYNRGIAKEMIRDEEGACNDWVRATQLGVAVAEDYYNSTCNQKSW